MKTDVHLWSYLAQFCLDWEMLQIKCVEKIKTRFMLNNVFRQLCREWDNAENYGRAGQATEDNMAHSRCMLDM